MVSKIFFIFTTTWGDDLIWLYNIFQMGWNHQPDDPFFCLWAISFQKIAEETLVRQTHRFSPKNPYRPLPSCFCLSGGPWWGGCGGLHGISVVERTNKYPFGILILTNGSNSNGEVWASWSQIFVGIFWDATPIPRCEIHRNWARFGDVWHRETPHSSDLNSCWMCSCKLFLHYWTWG